MVSETRLPSTCISESRERLTSILEQDLDFHGEISNYASHNFHSFPAKFPPQIPRKFILELTREGDIVLDPMVGSGTTILEALLADRQAIGNDIDPLALLITRVKTTPAKKDDLKKIGEQICSQAELTARLDHDRITQGLETRWDRKTKLFIDYWFAPSVQVELVSLIQEVEKISDPIAKDFFTLALSSIIITKTGGVSFALDLGHTRPHKAPKNIGSALYDFRRRVNKNISGLLEFGEIRYAAQLSSGNAQNLDIPGNSVDLIVTSPPYASNAIDYMRAHKFSLVWLGHCIEELGRKRKQYIGGETIRAAEVLPPGTVKIVEKLASLDHQKAKVLNGYFSDMFRTIREMYRVLKPGKVGIMVVGNSTIRGLDTETAQCLAEIGENVGFDVPKIGIRHLDRDRRMMPVGRKLNMDSLIQKRMYEEYVIGFLKK